MSVHRFRSGNKSTNAITSPVFHPGYSDLFFSWTMSGTKAFWVKHQRLDVCVWTPDSGLSCSDGLLIEDDVDLLHVAIDGITLGGFQSEDSLHLPLRLQTLACVHPHHVRWTWDSGLSLVGFRLSAPAQHATLEDCEKLCLIESCPSAQSSLLSWAHAFPDQVHVHPNEAGSEPVKLQNHVYSRN